MSIKNINPAIFINQASRVFDYYIENDDYAKFAYTERPNAINYIRGEFKRVEELVRNDAPKFAFTKFQKYWGEFDYQELQTIFAMYSDNEQRKGGRSWDVYRLLICALKTAIISTKVKFKKYKGYSDSTMKELEKLFRQVDSEFYEQMGHLTHDDYSWSNQYLTREEYPTEGFVGWVNDDNNIPQHPMMLKEVA